MPKHVERPQKNARLDEPDDIKQVDVKPLTNLGDRRNNPDDIEPDEAAMSHGIEHGGTTESRAESLSVRGSGGRKRSSGAHQRSQPGRDISKRR
jgi:hypothetical protein